MDIVAAVLAAFFFQFGSHFIPWAQIVGKRKLHRLAAYIIGTFTIGVIFSIWLLARNETPTLLVFWLIVIASGAGVSTGYGIEWTIRIRSRANEAEAREALREHQSEDIDEQIERLR